MYEELANILLYDAGWLEQGITQTERDIAEHLKKAAKAIEERDRYALTLQHEMMAEAESHIALVERLNKQIEELSKLADAIPHVCDCCIGCEVESGGCDRGFVLSPKRVMEYLSKRLWIPVTERFPDAYEDVMLKFPNNQAAGFCDRDGCWGVYSGDGFYTEVAENEPKPTHWAKKLPEPPKEENYGWEV